MRVLVTGGSGFVGRALVPALIQARHEVAVAIRRDTVLPEGVRPVRIGDLGRSSTWDADLSDFDSIVHLAGLAHARGMPADAYDRINRMGTQALAESAASSGITHLVVVSTVKVMGELSGDHPWREDDTPHPVSPYGRSKLAAEQHAQEASRHSRMIVTVFRPPPLYGPGMKGNLVRMMRWIASGRPLPLPAIRNGRSLLYVGNFVDAILRSLSAGERSRGTFFLRDGRDVALLELARAMADASHRPLRRIPVPAAVLRWAAAALGRGEDASLLLGTVKVDDGLFRRQVGWQPPWTLEQGLQATALWLARSGESALQRTGDRPAEG